ncbi:Vitamin B6 transporter [Lecanora helva]
MLSNEIPPTDLEKAGATVGIADNSRSSLEKGTFEFSSTPAEPTHIPVPTAFQRWNDRIESLAGLEARGIVRVLPEERQRPSALGYAQMAMVWFGANVVANNLAVGLLGPLLFELGFVDSAMMAVFGSIVGALPTAYMSVWGAQSGNRTMICARYFMGYWPAKLTCLLNIILMFGFATIACIISGQILSAVSGGSMTIIVGIVIVALISWLVAVFGMRLFHTYERYSWIPQVIVLFILLGSGGRHFNTALQSQAGSAATTAGRLSFFCLCMSVPLSWAAAASDFYVYYPESTNKPLTFLMTFTGLTLSFVLVTMVGVGLGSGVSTYQPWSDANDISPGALILAGFGDLGGFGKFCGVVVALGVISNNVPGTYAAALGCQVLGRYFKAVPRYLWVCVIAMIYFVCAIAGRDHLFTIFQNFLALVGYWIIIFVSIVLEEHVIFRRGVGFDWTRWEDQKYLPLGIAALSAFLIGWAGAIIGMDQAWFVGPVASKVGDNTGADIGIWLGASFTLVVFPPLRYLELKKFGR